MVHSATILPRILCASKPDTWMLYWSSAKVDLMFTDLFFARIKLGNSVNFRHA